MKTRRGRGSHSLSGVIGASVLLSLLLVALIAGRLAPRDPFEIAGDALRPPSSAHIFGTDDLGRDVFAGVVHGAANSLILGLIGALSAGILGMLVGGIAAVSGGFVDDLLMRATEFVTAIPRFFLIITMVSFLGGTLWLIALVIALTSWPDTARVCRAQIQSLLGRDFVMASRAAGSTEGVILVRHILPLTVSIIAAHASYQAGGAILTEAALSFLGLGDPRVMSWGTLLGSAQYLVREGWWVSVFPGLAITATVFGSNLLADSLLLASADDGVSVPAAFR